MEQQAEGIGPEAVVTQAICLERILEIFQVVANGHVGRGRVPRVVPGDHGKHERGVLDASAQRSGMIQ